MTLTFSFHSPTQPLNFPIHLLKIVCSDQDSLKPQPFRGRKLCPWKPFSQPVSDGAINTTRVTE